MFRARKQHVPRPRHRVHMTAGLDKSRYGDEPRSQPRLRTRTYGGDGHRQLGRWVTRYLGGGVRVGSDFRWEDTARKRRRGREARYVCARVGEREIVRVSPHNTAHRVRLSNCDSVLRKRSECLGGGFSPHSVWCGAVKRDGREEGEVASDVGGAASPRDRARDVCHSLFAVNQSCGGIRALAAL